MKTMMVAGLVLCSLAIQPTAHAEEKMGHVTMATSIGEGADQQVDKLHENAWTKLVQITLRNEKVLSRHTAREAITVQCVSGEGVLVIGEGERIALTPGVIVALEPNVPHEVEAKPAVSVLVTRFNATAAASAPEHVH